MLSVANDTRVRARKRKTGKQQQQEEEGISSSDPSLTLVSQSVGACHSS
jgi:hypothetical protein